MASADNTYKHCGNEDDISCLLRPILMRYDIIEHGLYGFNPYMRLFADIRDREEQVVIDIPEGRRSSPCPV